MKVLITGGCGFIGSNFIRYLLTENSNYDVLNLDNLSYAGNKNNLNDVRDRKDYELIRGDIRDNQVVNRLTEKADVVINFAAETHVDASINGPSKFVNTNIRGTHTLLKHALKNDIKNFLQISTDEVYGSINEGKFTEEDCLDPSNPYSASKSSADLLALSYYKTYGLPVTVTRSSNNFGPYQYPEKLIPLFVTNLLEEKKVPLYGNGSNVRDWLYVKDNCRAIKTVLEDGREGEIYNIGANNERTNLEITETILDILGKDEGYIEYVEDRPGHDQRYALNSTKIRDLGWQPRVGYEEGMRKTVRWYQNHKSWWQQRKA